MIANKLLMTASLILATILPLKAVQASDLSRMLHGDNGSWQRDSGDSYDEDWQARHQYWQMRQARRDCYRYGDCDRFYRMRDRRYGDDNGWGYRHHDNRRGGIVLQFGG
ncbi:hypothetical protein SAZ10_01000 [Mesorhizobium sp. BAC0120]|uniref:hypothetical protein n=1 Tax=Mesorhizobium sp. BAC0120 TaxID=3090670 RepID=UPI00298C6D39|nr:hypothetical protein [Mesorhizobium sp. BAC0120]MDW6020333.1 hypothetical protein [Mesorhizobium sp. BAC0120]